MYCLITFVPGHPMILPNLTLVEAFRKLNAIGRGAIWRGSNPSPYAKPIYPKARRA